MTTPYDDGGGEPLAAPPGAPATPPGFAPPGQTPTYQGQPLASPRVSGQKGLFILMAVFAVVAVGAGLAFFGGINRTEFSSGAELFTTPVTVPTYRQPVVTASPAGPVPKPVTYRGTGNDVIRIRKPEAGPALVDIKGTPGPNGLFSVWSLDSSGQKIGVVVAAFDGPYSGTRLFDPTEFLTTASFEVEASGPWTLTVRSARSAKTFDGTVSGSGDTVVRYTGAPGTASINGGTAGKPFLVMVHASGFPPRLLVTSVGAFQGRKAWPAGPTLVQVQSKGRWSITVR